MIENQFDEKIQQDPMKSRTSVVFSLFSCRLSSVHLSGVREKNTRVAISPSGLQELTLRLSRTGQVGENVIT